MKEGLYQFPAATAFANGGARIAKAALFVKKKPAAAVRDAFAKHVERLLVTHELNAVTTPLAASIEVPKVIVMQLELREAKCPEALLAYIDAAQPLPTIFELRHGDQAQQVATYKRPSRSKPGETVTHGYFSSPWAPVVGLRQNLPRALDLAQLYHRLVGGLLPVAERAGEGIEAWVQRAEQYVKLERELARLQARHKRELQFNLKLELRAELARVAGELAGLG